MRGIAHRRLKSVRVGAAFAAMRTFACLVVVLLSAVSAHAKIVMRSVPYEHGGVKLAGYLAFDDE
jgi:hypothetical protein